MASAQTPDKRLQPATALWKRYDPASAPLAFRATTVPAARAWQTKVRRELSAALGFQDTPAVAFRPRGVERVDKGDYIREKYYISVAPDSVMPFYLLTPKGVANPATVIALHGHGYGVKDIVGLRADGTDRDAPEGYHKDFGVALCRSGFVVAAPEISCFGERQNNYEHLKAYGSPVPPTCAQTAALAAHLGGTAAGLRVLEARRLVDYLASRGDIDTVRLGAMGISGGGLHTFYSAILDTRIRACVVSGYFCTFEHSILAMHHCACNFVPGLGRFGEMADLAACIAPRPMLVEAASRDTIFPLHAVKKSVAQARRNCAVFGMEKPIETDYFEGEHEISGRKAYAFLRKHLSAE